jgi:guanylate kinase
MNTLQNAIENQTKQRLFLVISGPSAGAGKDSVERGLISRYGLQSIVTYNTRKPRVGEKDGVDYHFISREEFEKKIQDNFFLEHKVYLDNYYGIPESDVREKLSQGNDVVVRVDVRGARSIKEKIPSAVLIYVTTPSIENLRSHLLKRNDDPAMIEKKLEVARWELEQFIYFDYLVVNEEGKLEETISKVYDIILAERMKVIRYT